MDEYISREAVLQTLQKANIGGYITERLLEIPSADVQPVRHGRWIWDSNQGAYKCNNCGYHSDFEENYCYNCGAKMINDGD